MAAKIGIVAGSGTLPRRLIESCQASGREVFVLALDGEAEPEAVAGVPHAWCRLGAAGKGLDLLRANEVRELVLAGGVRRPSIASLRPDWRAAKFFARVGRRVLGDDGLLSAVVKELEQEGFRVLGADQLLKGAGLPEGPLGRIAPDGAARSDIELGIRIAQALGALDIGQAVVVQQGLVLGVEAWMARAGYSSNWKNPGRSGGSIARRSGRKPCSSWPRPGCEGSRQRRGPPSSSTETR